MARVILIAILSVLAATHWAGSTRMPPTRWTTRPTSVVTSAALVPPLVRVNRVTAVEILVSATSRLVGDEQTTPNLQPILRTGSALGSRGHVEFLRNARGTTAAGAMAQFARAQILARRPFRRAWVWLSRKQP